MLTSSSLLLLRRKKESILDHRRTIKDCLNWPIRKILGGCGVNHVCCFGMISMGVIWVSWVIKAVSGFISCFIICALLGWKIVQRERVTYCAKRKKRFERLKHDGGNQCVSGGRWCIILFNTISQELKELCDHISDLFNTWIILCGVLNLCIFSAGCTVVLYNMGSSLDFAHAIPSYSLTCWCLLSAVSTATLLVDFLHNYSSSVLLSLFSLLARILELNTLLISFCWFWIFCNVWSTL